MSRPYIIDPEFAANTNTEAQRQPTQIPPEVREFGYIWDLQKLKSGDLLLFESLSPSKISRKLSEAQRFGGFSEQDARWTHAAVFVTDTRIVEAVPFGGVTLGSIFDRMINSRVVVRRVPRSTKLQRAELCVHALSTQRESYDIGYLARIWRQFKNPLSWDPILRDGEGNVCSMLYHRAFLRTYNTLVCPAKQAGIAPADLSATSTLNDIRVDWLKLS